MDSVRKFISQIITTGMYPFALLVLTIKSELNRFRSLQKPDQVKWNDPYSGQPVFLFAAFQKGTFRPDTMLALDAAKAAGFYVLVVNTGKLTTPDALKGSVDAYVERYNFGRDFGSYKSGFLHLFKQKIIDDCPRLLMMNDSVFVTRDRIGAFLADMKDTDLEVLGSTENYEIEYHLGSFCISMAGNVLRHPKFKTYWTAYRNSDIRPTVIRRGEMGLSKMLKKAVTSEDQIKSLYDSWRFYNLCEADNAYLDMAVTAARVSVLTDWPRISLGEITQAYIETRMLSVLERDESAMELKVDTTEPLESVSFQTIDDCLTYLRRVARDKSTIDTDGFRRFAQSEIVKVFMSGSQIHQNQTLLLKLGLPIVKLDGLYRGMFNIEDMTKIAAELEEVDAKALLPLLLTRPYGGNTLMGWKRSAFLRGLI